MDTMEVFSQNLKRFMDKHDLKQPDIAKITGVSQQSVSNWLASKQMPRMGIIEDLACYFDIKKSELIEDPENTQEQSDVEEYLEYLHKRPEMKMLFSATKNVTKEELEQVVKMIETFKNNR